MKSCKECGNERCLLNATEGYCLDCPECGVNWEKKMEFDKSRVFSSVNADELRAGDKVIVADDMTTLKMRVKANEEAYPLDEVCGEDWEYRFCVVLDKASDLGSAFSLAYLVERAENCTNCEYQSRSECLKEKKDNILYCCEFYKSRTLKGCENCIHADIKDSGTMLCRMGFLDCTPPHNFICSDYEPKTEQKAEKKSCYNCPKRGTRSCYHADKVSLTFCCEDYPKTEKHYRPFEDTDELIRMWEQKWSEKTNGQKWHDCKLNMPLIWVRRKEGNIKGQLITEFSNSLWVGMSTEGYNMTDLFEHFTFLDGSPCGVKE